MRRSVSTLAAWAAACVIGLCAAVSAQAAEAKASRIVAIGGSVTEIVYALGEEARLVGRDSTSIYPPEALKLPDTGYIRALSPEGVLSLNPDLILTLEGAGPPPALDALKAAGVRNVMIPEGFDRKAIVTKIGAVGAALGVEDKAKTFSAKVEAELDKAVAASATASQKARVLFVLSARGGRIMAAGEQTQADGIIKLAGAENVLSSIQSYKPVSDEAIIEAAPDVILMMAPRGDHSTGSEELLALPAIAATPAGKARRVVRMDGMYLLGFGPRTADAIVSLHDALYGQRKPGE
ncbi:heme/hemin ABC transporter substrate-binding protein [Rhizobium sp. C4]|uniref:heme/hemin ABC transporter substrate-binding protein n=1 Tax=Rhizobium sp. C4 TaxID=1349800 RepID=UPI001E520B17|nr:ABC transporter substrate-binding protein [Rhizobium sp. C4]MCD2172088.1 ABC transporter substrate-binding protein [Rhizobium sp. C4]